MPIQRRTFVVGGLAVVGAGTYAWLQARGYDVDPAVGRRRGEPHPPVAALPHAPFDPRALTVLAAVVHQLLPGDSALGLPSATEAGVLDFLITAAAEPGLLPVRNDILKLTRHLDIIAQRIGGARYGAVTDEVRQTVLAETVAGDERTRTFDPQRALETLLRLALEGYLGHPDHGGNLDGRVWAALKIDMPKNGHERHQP